MIEVQQVKNTEVPQKAADFVNMDYVPEENGIPAVLERHTVIL